MCRLSVILFYIFYGHGVFASAGQSVLPAPQHEIEPLPLKAQNLHDIRGMYDTQDANQRKNIKEMARILASNFAHHEQISEEQLRQCQYALGSVRTNGIDNFRISDFHNAIERVNTLTSDDKNAFFKLVAMILVAEGYEPSVLGILDGVDGETLSGATLLGAGAGLLVGGLVMVIVGASLTGYEYTCGGYNVDRSVYRVCEALYPGTRTSHYGSSWGIAAETALPGGVGLGAMVGFFIGNGLKVCWNGVKKMGSMCSCRSKPVSIQRNGYGSSNCMSKTRLNELFSAFIRLNELVPAVNAEL